MLYYKKYYAFCLQKRVQPSVPVRKVQRFSRPSRSTTPASFQWSIIFEGKGRKESSRDYFNCKKN